MNENDLRALLERYRCVGLTGPANSGKTTLADRVSDSATVLHGDDYQPLGSSEATAALARATAVAADGARPVLIEGVTVPRAVRKGAPVRCLVVLSEGRPLNRGQEAQWAGVQTVVREITGAFPDLVVTHRHSPIGRRGG